MAFPKDGPKNPFGYEFVGDDDMEIDSHPKTGFADDQTIKDHRNRAENAALQRLYNKTKTGSKEQDWRRAHGNHGNKNKRGNQQNRRNNRNGNNGQNRNQNGGGNKNNRGNQGNQNNQVNQNQQNNGGSRRTKERKWQGGQD